MTGTATCAVCATAFEGRADARYCSNACRKRAARLRGTATKSGTEKNSASLVNTYAATAWSKDYPAGVTAEQYERVIAYIEREWGTGRVLRALMPSFDVNEPRQRQFERPVGLRS